MNITLIGIVTALLGLAFGVHRANWLSDKLKDVSSVLLAVAGSTIGADHINTTFINPPMNNEVIEEMRNAILDSIETSKDSVMAAKDEIKQLIRDGKQETEAVHDSILIKIAAVDSCIDRHFRSTNRRLTHIAELIERQRGGR